MEEETISWELSSDLEKKLHDMFSIPRNPEAKEKWTRHYIRELERENKDYQSHITIENEFQMNTNNFHYISLIGEFVDIQKAGENQLELGLPEYHKIKIKCVRKNKIKFVIYH